MKREKKTKDREVHILTIGPYTITADSRQYIVKGVKVSRDHPALSQTREVKSLEG